MKVYRRLILTMICALAVLTNGTSVLPQTAKQDKQPKQDILVLQDVTISEFEQEVQKIDVEVSDGGDTFVYVSSEFGFEGKLVKGAPYSAQAVTESIRVLADGNRIVHKNTATVYRDSEGRTRREQTLGRVGNYAAEGDPPQMVIINDPVAGVNYTLNARDKTARKIEFGSGIGFSTGGGVGVGGFGGRGEGSARAGAIVRPMRRPAPAPPAPEALPAPPVIVERHGAGVFSTEIRAGHDRKHREPKIESLGKQMIEGVEAEGTRSTITIPAGEIGNEQPINIVSERWYSPELQVVVMSKRSDPQSGETTYRLTNINRSEPARSLFEVPSDYTIDEVKARGPLRRVEPREKKDNQL